MLTLLKILEALRFKISQLQSLRTRVYREKRIRHYTKSTTRRLDYSYDYAAHSLGAGNHRGVGHSLRLPRHRSYFGTKPQCHQVWNEKSWARKTKKKRRMESFVLALNFTSDVKLDLLKKDEKIIIWLQKKYEDLKLTVEVECF